MGWALSGGGYYPVGGYCLAGEVPCRASVDLILSLSKDEVVALQPPLARPRIKPGQALMAKQAHHEANWNEFYANCTDPWLYDRRTHTRRSSPSALSRGLYTLA